jgi:hypothetical protein
LTAKLVNSPTGTESQWIERDEKFQVFIDKEEFAEGKTKKAYKVRILFLNKNYCFS